MRLWKYFRFIVLSTSLRSLRLFRIPKSLAHHCYWSFNTNANWLGDDAPFFLLRNHTYNLLYLDSQEGYRWQHRYTRLPPNHRGPSWIRFASCRWLNRMDDINQYEYRCIFIRTESLHLNDCLPLFHHRERISILTFYYEGDLTHTYRGTCRVG